MSKLSFREYVKSAITAHKNIAKVKIENDKMIIVNIATGSRHPFVDGRMEIPLSPDQIKLVIQLLENV
jgi:hypothetical protein